LARQCRRACGLLAVAALADALRLSDDSEEGVCECINWAKVYGTDLTQCGDGLELLGLALYPSRAFADAAKAYTAECSPSLNESNLESLQRSITSSGPCGAARLRSMDNEDCNNILVLDHETYRLNRVDDSAFYPHQNHNRCIKAAPFALPRSPRHHDSWCYVSSKCKSLNGGVSVNENVSAKLCTWGTDRDMAELDIPAICGLQDTIRPKAKGLGGCLLGIYKAFDRGASTWEKQLKLVPGLKDPRRRPNYWKAENSEMAVVQRGERRWKVEYDWHAETCMDGCDP